MRKDDLSPVTQRGYRHDLGAFVRWLAKARGDEPRLEDLTSIDLLSFRQHMVNIERLKPSTVNRRIQAVRCLCRWARREGMQKTDITENVKSLRTVRRNQPKGLLEPEVHALLRAAGESKHGLAKRNYALVQLFIQAGLRVNEAAMLIVGDAMIRDRTGSVRVRHGKGRKEREIPLNATARRALRMYLDSRPKRKPEEPLFESREDSAMSVRTMQAVITALGRRAKITRLRVSAHILRHSFALHYLRDNPGKLVELASLLGHESLDTTAIYTRPSQEDLAQDLERARFNVYD